MMPTDPKTPPPFLPPPSRSKFLPAAVLALATLLASTPLFSQGTTATLGGTVTDASGAVIPNAQVTLKSETSDDKRTTTSNGSGVFSFSGVPSGTYDVTISATGFKGFQQNAVHLDPGDTRSVRDIHLSAGGVNDVVEVTSGSDSINLDSGEQSSLISAQDIQHLSVEGRDVTELFKTLPGFAISNGSGSVDNRAYDPSQVSVNGALGSYAANGSPLNGIALLSDGADITDPGNFGGSVQNVNYEQVAEVKVQTSSFTADGARGPIVVNAVGKSGGNKYHGSLYTYARTSQLNSTDWIANYLGQQKPPDRQVYPGFTFGGPLAIPGIPFNKSKKLTFFVGAEQYAQRNAYAYGGAAGAVLTALVPTANMRKGDFSAPEIQSYLGTGYTPTINGCSGTDANLCTIPTTGPQGQALVNGNISAFLDPLSSVILNEMPLPNTASTGTYNWTTTNLVDNNLYQAKIRVDDHISDNMQVFGVYSVERGTNGVPQAEYYSPRGNLGGVNIPGGGLISTIDSQIASLNITNTFGPTLTNEFYGAGIYFKQNFAPKNLAATQGNPYQGLFNNGSTVQPTLEDYGNDGLPLSRLPDGSYGGIYAAKEIRTFGDNLTKVIGKHTVRLGAFYQLDSNHQVLPFINTNGTINLYYFPETYTDPVAGLVHNTGQIGSGNGGNYLANFAEGHVFQYNQTNFAPAPNVFFYNLDGYVQDHWRIAQRLTVDLGIRFEHFTPWGDAHGQGIPVFSPTAYANNTNPTLPGFLYHSIDKNTPVTGLGTRWAYVEPRVGFSWDVYGGGKTILRGGFGIYRAHDSSNDATNGVGSVQGQRTAYLNGPINLSSISSQASMFTNPSGFSPDVNAYGFLANDDEQPQIKTYNLSVDQRLPGNMLLEVAYVGNNSNHILNNGSTQNTNIADINSLPIGSLFQPQPNTRGFTNVGQVYPNFAPAGATGNNLTVGGLDQAHIDSYKKYPLYNHLYIAQHNLYANYNGLQVALAKQQGKALFGVNYTFSKALGVLGGDNNGYPGDPFNFHNDYQEETYDHRHIFNATYTYQFGNLVKSKLIGIAANGWEASGISNYQSGANLPSINNPNFSISGNLAIANGVDLGNGRGTCQTPAASDANPNPSCSLAINNTNILGTPDVNLQPLLVGNPSAKRGSHQYINGNAFAVPSIGTNGAYRYGFLPGPGYFNTDLTVAKRFAITEKTSVQLKAAAFNAINHGNNSFTNVRSNDYTLNFNQSTPQTNANAGLNNDRNINTTFGSAPLREGRRIMELALRFDF
jgi:hypothetical protein